MSGAEWIKRPYLPEDEAALVYLWCSSYQRSFEGRRRGAHVPYILGVEQKDDPAVREARRVLWAEMAPLMELLLRTTDVELVVDPERPVSSAAGPALVYGFAATSGDVVHYVSVKRDMVKAGFGPDIVRELLGDRLERRCGYTHELVEMAHGACGVRLPRDWYWDLLWLPRRLVGLRQVAGVDGDVRGLRRAG